MEVSRADLIDRIWERDPTVWTGGDEARWLGWLDEPLRMRERVTELVRFSDDVADEGLDGVVLLGMGGSSLAPEVLCRCFRSMSFHILDTTHPEAIRAVEEEVDVASTLFIVSSKSGTTLETRCLGDWFWERAGRDGRRFVAITDPGTELEALAGERDFRAVFPGEPTIGGRYAALSPFGMVPAALMGVDLGRLLANAERMHDACRRADGNPGYELGRALGVAWEEGRDKVAVVPNAAGFGLWVEQLIAESTGKNGKGLVPAPGGRARGPDVQVAQVALADPYSLGGEFFRWEFAVAVACAYLGVNPFDQPDVQAAKDRIAAVLARDGEPELEPEGSVEELVAQARPGNYIAVLAFVQPTYENDRRLRDLAEKLRRRSGVVVTCAYGPRYLHSTGQLHKGGPPTGLFLQIVDDPGDELRIPGRPFGFRRLLRAQAAGDYEALKECGRPVARIRLDDL
jgi:glucose-6-phosphate isomerase